MADLKARELRGRLQGPPAAWPTCDPFRRWPSVSTRGKAPVLKSRRRGQDELCLPPRYTAPKEAQSNGQHPARARMKARECRASARARSANQNFCFKMKAAGYTADGNAQMVLKQMIICKECYAHQSGVCA